MKVNVMLNDYPHRSKPTGEQVKSIQSNFQSVEMTLDELVTALTNGKTIRPAVMSGKTKNTFRQAEIIAVDIDNKCDNKLTVSQAVSLAAENGLNVWFCYYSFSHKPDCPKFRLVFRLDKPVTDLTAYENLKKSYAAVFGQAADAACSNADRIYFGTQCKDIPYRCDSAVNHVGDAPAVQKQKPSRKRKVTKSKATGKFNTAHMQAIRDNRPERLHELLGSPAKRWFENNAEFYSYLFSINLIDFLGLSIRLDEKFRCLKPGHVDNHPSARIFETENGNFLYFCDKDGKLNIKQIVEMLAGFKMPGETIRFLKAALNIEVVQTDSSRQQIENLDSWAAAVSLNGADSFAAICPTANKILREKGKTVLLSVLSYAKRTVCPHADYKDGVIFTMPLSMLADNERDRNELEKNLKTLIALHVVETVPINQVPKRLLNSIVTRPKDGDKPNSDPTIYRIPGWVLSQQDIINDSAALWRSKKMTKSQMSFDFVTTKLGEKEAKRIYPSYAEYSSSKEGEVTKEKRKVSEHNRQLDSLIAETMFSLIEENGYCTKQMIINHSGLTLKQVSKRLNIVADNNGIDYVRCTPKLREELEMDEPRNTIIYLQ